MKKEDLKKFLNIVETRLVKTPLVEHEESLAIIGANLKELVAHVTKMYPELRNVVMGNVEIIRKAPNFEYETISKDINFDKDSLLGKMAPKGQIKIHFLENINEKYYAVSIWLVHKDVNTNRVVSTLLKTLFLDFAGKITESQIVEKTEMANSAYNRKIAEISSCIEQLNEIVKQSVLDGESQEIIVTDIYRLMKELEKMKDMVVNSGQY